MHVALRWSARVVVFLGVVFWFFGGPNLGWTKTSVPVPKKDPVTELEYVEWQANFVPGVDFLGGVLGLGAVLGAAGWWVGSRKVPVVRRDGFNENSEIRKT